MRTFQGAGLAPTLAAACFFGVWSCIAGPAASQPEPAGVRAAATAQPRAIARRPDDAPSLSELQTRLDDSDRVAALHALHMALNNTADGGTFVWQKTSRELKGVIKPTSAFRNAHGQVCRHVIYALALGPYRKQIEFVACREAQGRWRL